LITTLIPLTQLLKFHCKNLLIHSCIISQKHYSQIKSLELISYNEDEVIISFFWSIMCTYNIFFVQFFKERHKKYSYLVFIQIDKTVIYVLYRSKVISHFCIILMRLFVHKFCFGNIVACRYTLLI